jgi:hypothetical protein
MEFLDSGFIYFLLIIAPIALCYFASVLFFPDLDKVSDLQVYFDSNFRHIGISLSGFILANMMIGFWLKEEALSLATLIKSINIILISSAAILGSKKLRRVVAYIVAIVIFAGSIKLGFV